LNAQDPGVEPQARDGARPGVLGAWAAATRPRSLLVAFSPVLVGAALGYSRTGHLDPSGCALVACAALLMQLITNLQNDVGFTLRGGERSGRRIGLPRATAKGWLRVGQVRAAIALAACLALGLGLTLTLQRGWPVLAIGSASLVAALAYMGGPRPIAYTPLGELTVFVFFGVVAVCGTEWVLSGSVVAADVAASLAIGGLAACALVVNNHRDMAHDREIGRATFAVTFGVQASRRLFDVCLFAPFALVPVIAALAQAPAMLVALLPLPAALRLRDRFAHCPAGSAFNLVLFRTFALELQFAALLAIGAVLARALR